MSVARESMRIASVPMNYTVEPPQLQGVVVCTHCHQHRLGTPNTRCGLWVVVRNIGDSPGIGYRCSGWTIPVEIKEVL